MRKIKVILLIALLLMTSSRVVYSSTTSNRVIGVSNEIILAQTNTVSGEKPAIIPTLVIVGALVLAGLYTAASSYAQNPPPLDLENKNQQLYFID